MDLFITATGVVTTIYDETIDLQVLGSLTITRASQVEPDQAGRWSALIIDGPSLGPFARRSEALAAEVDWLVQHRLTANSVVPSQ